MREAVDDAILCVDVAIVCGRIELSGTRFALSRIWVESEIPTGAITSCVEACIVVAVAGLVLGVLCVGVARNCSSICAALMGDELAESANAHANGTKAAARIKNLMETFSLGITPQLCSMPLS